MYVSESKQLARKENLGRKHWRSSLHSVCDLRNWTDNTVSDPGEVPGGALASPHLFFSEIAHLL